MTATDDSHVTAKRRLFPRRRAKLWHRHGSVLVAVSLGGGIGAVARYGLSLAWPKPSDGFPWATFITNVSGCLLIGILMVLVTEVWPGHRLLRPFFGVGVLGGYTTFSTYIVDLQQLVRAGEAFTGLIYLLASIIAALAATYTGDQITRVIIHKRGVQ